MKEIKFRAWHKKDKKMYDVSCIYFYDNKTIVSMPLHIPGFEMLCKECIVGDIELMQYTGLNDNSDCLLEGKEDKEVYEGDIVTVSYKDKAIKACVKHEKGMFILISNEFADGYIPIFEVANSDREYQWIDGIVIGNVFENPELLNQSSTL